MAAFASGEVTTELPNLLLAGSAASSTASGKSAPLKRPAATLKRPASESTIRCHVEYYKNKGVYCVRHTKRPRKVICWVRNRSWSQEELRCVALQAVEKVEGGMSEGDVLAWVESATQ